MQLQIIESQVVGESVDVAEIPVMGACKDGSASYLIVQQDPTRGLNLTAGGGIRDFTAGEMVAPLAGSIHLGPVVKEV